MLIIRHTQLAALHDEAMHRFDQRVATALADGFAADAERLGDEGLCRVVRLGRQRAVRHGWRSEQALYLYVALMLMLGAGFDDDPLLPWVAPTLQRNARHDAAHRIFTLHATALDHLDAVAGERNEHLWRALLQLRSLDLAEFDAFDQAALWAALPQRMAVLYPAKAAAAGIDGMAAWARRVAAKAAQHGLHRPRDTALLACVTFMLGCDADADPAWPWVAAALASSRPAPQRAEALHRAALAQIKLSLAATAEA